MGNQLESLPLRAPLGIVGPKGQVVMSQEWLAAFSRIDTLLRNTTESWTTANRPTSGLYVGRGGFNTTLGMIDVWTGSIWIQLEAGSGTFLPISGGTMTGDIVLAGNPDAALKAAPKQYVDLEIDDTKHGNRGGGALHADVVAAGADGFMIGADKTILNDLSAAKGIFNGAIVQSVAVVVASAAGQWTLTVADQAAGNNLDCYFNGTRVTLDVTSPVSVNLTAGTDTAPQASYVYLTESGGTVTLAASTVGFPTGEDFCPIATVYLQSAASGATDGAYKVHAWTDHIATSLTGHLAHVNEKFRAQHADYVSGVAPTLTIAASTVFVETTAGVVYQLHKHTFPARTMSAVPGDPIFVVNEPGTAYNRITDLDDLTVAVDSATLDGKHFSLVVWGVVSEAEADCKLYLNLPTGVYNTQAQAVANLEKKSVYTIPGDFKGTGFLIAEFIVQANLGGTWVLHQTNDLRDLFPTSVAGGGSAGVTDHGELTGLADDNHTQYLLADGSRAMAAALDMGTNKITGGVAGVAGTDFAIVSQLGAGGGQTELVESVALGGSGNTITHTFVTGYDYYLRGDGLRLATDGGVVYLRANADSGSNYTHLSIGSVGGGAPNNQVAGGDTEIQFSTTGVGNGTRETMTFRLELGDFEGALNKYAVGYGFWQNSAGTYVSRTISGSWTAAAAVTSIFLGATGGTPHFSAGVATLFRVKRT